MNFEKQLIKPSSNILKMESYLEKKKDLNYLKNKNSQKSFIKLDSNENPFGPPSTLKFKPSFINTLNRYPDPLSSRFLSSLSNQLNISSDYLIAGAGSDELLDLIIRCYVEKGETISSLFPTFGMYRIYAQINDVNYNPIKMKLNVNKSSKRAKFEISEERLMKNIEKSKIVILARPNNPDGSLLNEDLVISVLEERKLVVLDEAYIEFSQTKSLYRLTREYANLIVLRTLSKAYGLAGLRIGYAIMDPQLKKNLLVIKAPYNVNSAASEAAVIALNSQKEVDQKIKKIVENRRFLFEELSGINNSGFFFSLHKSFGNFLLIRLSNYKEAFDLYNFLLKKGIIVRAFREDILNSCLRISIGRKNEMKRLISVIKSFFEVY
jgi:histidinol-phosphate aminotransferase